MIPCYSTFLFCFLPGLVEVAGSAFGSDLFLPGVRIQVLPPW
jgi:hypothetical protein